MTTPSTTRTSRLIRAGYVYVGGWVPNGKAAFRVNVLLDEHRVAAEAIASTQPPRGRPKTPKPSRKAPRETPHGKP